jgi:O-acetyl-ADP-ribose deacetylase (regulator of RNase III)
MKNFGKIKIIKGDITKVKAEAIVNAANRSLLGGGGVDGAIHRAAGPKLLEECRKLGGCQTGQAKITKGYNLPAKYVIHTVGPVWRGGQHNEAKLLKGCYLNSLKLAEKRGIKSIAFPAISTGAYGYPIEEAAEIAIKTVKEYLKKSKIEEIIFVLFSEKDYNVYRDKMKDFAHVN